LEKIRPKEKSKTVEQ
jgi:hypothetical protein